MLAAIGAQCDQSTCACYVISGIGSYGVSDAVAESREVRPVAALTRVVEVEAEVGVQVDR